MLLSDGCGDLQAQTYFSDARRYVSTSSLAAAAGAMQVADTNHMDTLTSEPLSLTSSHQQKRRGMRRHTTFDESSASNECDCDTCLLGFDDTEADGVARTPKMRPSAVGAHLTLPAPPLPTLQHDPSVAAVTTDIHRFARTQKQA